MIFIWLVRMHLPSCNARLRFRKLMLDKPKYSQEQIAAAVAFRKSSFHEFMHSMMAEHADDVRFKFYVDNLLVVIYEHHLNGKFIAKNQACRLIPIGHSNTCKKYVEEAQRRGFIKFERDNKDERRMNVVPTEQLLSYVQSKMETAIDEARELIGSVSEVKPLPKDNRPLANFPR